MACCHRGGLHECLVRAAPPDLTSLAACFGPLQPRRPVAPSRPPLAGCRPRKSQLTPAQRLAPLPRCVAPRPPLAISRTMTTLTCAAVAGLWRASGPGAAVGRLCCQPAAPAAGWAQALGWVPLGSPRPPCGALQEPRAPEASHRLLRAWFLRPRAIGCGGPAPQPHSQLAADRAPPVLGRSTCR